MHGASRNPRQHHPRARAFRPRGDPALNPAPSLALTLALALNPVPCLALALSLALTPALALITTPHPHPCSNPHLTIAPARA